VHICHSQNHRTSWTSKRTVLSSENNTNNNVNIKRRKVETALESNHRSKKTGTQNTVQTTLNGFKVEEKEISISEIDGCGNFQEAGDVPDYMQHGLV
jgi:hypothetical protein